MKVSRPVLRGGGGGNAAPLPDSFFDTAGMALTKELCLL